MFTHNRNSGYLVLSCFNLTISFTSVSQPTVQKCRTGQSFSLFNYKNWPLKFVRLCFFMCTEVCLDCTHVMQSLPCEQQLQRWQLKGIFQKEWQRVVILLAERKWKTPCHDKQGWNNKQLHGRSELPCHSPVQKRRPPPYARWVWFGSGLPGMCRLRMGVGGLGKPHWYFLQHGRTMPDTHIHRRQQYVVDVCSLCAAEYTVS